MSYKKTFFPLLVFIFLCQNLAAQKNYTAENVHAHNDYLQPIPFHTAYHRQIGSIEADLFLQNGALYVAHELKEIRHDRTLETLYLKPLQAQIRKNKGTPYPQPNAGLQLLIDFKTEGKTTLPVLVKILAKYPEISANAGIRIVISGNKPAPVTWAQYPDFICFDGTPGEHYTPQELQRIALFSANFRKYSQWNGKDQIAGHELDRITELIESVHHLNKKFRFWATPDNINTWKTLMDLGVDYIGTDDVTGLTDYLKNLPAGEFQH